MCLCGLFGLSSPKKKKFRISRMPTFGSRKRQPVHPLKHIVDIATLVSPTHNGFHKPTNGHVCPEYTEKAQCEIDGATDTSEERIKCPHEHHHVPHGRPTAEDPEDAKLGIILPAIQEHLKRVYHEARGRHEKLTKEDFINFLRITQGEESAIIPKKDEYAETEFLEEWAWRYKWGVLRPLRPEEKDLSKPISNYLISSSHNTYLVGNQLTSSSSANVYRKVLQRHCRCIEIDIWNGDVSGTRTPMRSKSPVPGHSRHLSSSSLPRAAAETVVAIGDKYQDLKRRAARSPDPNARGERSLGTVKKLIPGLHSRHKSLNGFVPPVVEWESSKSLDPNDLTARLQRPRDRSKSSRHSLNRSEPIVMHGWTLTAPVGFRDVCKAIRDSAFTKDNDLPIIISLEVHADMEQQEVMVDIMKEEWAGFLLEKPLQDCKPGERQPSLEELRKKILIKVKRPPNNVTLPPGNNATLMLPGSLEEDGCANGSERCELPEKYSSGDVDNKKQPPPVVAVPICESLSALAIYTHSEPFRSDFKIPSAQTHSHIFSVAESRILELHASSKKAELEAHNRRFFMRAYPDGWRFNSSNMDPSLFWRKGVQMVAMNWQFWDEGMMLNDAMFAPDTRGWVLKPPGFRSDDSEAAVRHKTLDLRITIYAGQHIPLPEAWNRSDDIPGALLVGSGVADKWFRPYVEVKLLVEKAEEKEKAAKPKADEKTPKIKSEAKFLTPKQLPAPKFIPEERISTTTLVSEDGSVPKLPSDEKIAKSGEAAAARLLKEAHYKLKTPAKETSHPDWGSYGHNLEFIDIPKVVEELSFVRFKVEDASKKDAAWACVRLDRLRQGYRFVDLVDCKGNPTEGRLFVKIDKVMR